MNDALTLEVVRQPGTYFEYAQSAVALLAEAVGRSTGGDVQAFLQRELLDTLGHPGGLVALGARPGGTRAGVLRSEHAARRLRTPRRSPRRGGVWRGQRLLAPLHARGNRPFQDERLLRLPDLGERGTPCIGPTVSERPVSQTRDFPSMPADLYSFAGLFGQRVSVFPSLGIVLVRTGQHPGLLFSVGPTWEEPLQARARRGDRPEGRAGRRWPPAGRRREEPGLRLPDRPARAEPVQPGRQPRAAPARRARARARGPALAGGMRPDRRGRMVVRVWCPPRWLSPLEATCRGVARAKGTRRALTLGCARSARPSWFGSS